MKLEKLMETVRELPQEFDLEELMERLVFIEKVERGLDSLHKGRTISHDAVKELIKEWQK